MITLDVLAIGDLTRDSDGRIIEANSTSTLIRTDEAIIVVDTSTEKMLPAIKTSMKQIGVLPKEVDYVVLTHSHSDHIGNIGFFPKAKVLIRAEEASKVKGSVPLDSDRDLVKGVRLVHTPGHTKGSMSVFVDADMHYVIAGDAIPLKENLIRMVPPALNYDPDVAMISIKAVSKYADVVIPGHGLPFPTGR